MPVYIYDMEVEQVPFLSIDVIRAELDIEDAALTKTSEMADTRAGIVLGFTAALAALAAATPSVLVLPGTVAAVLSALAATSVLQPRRIAVIDPDMLRTRYAAAPEHVTKKVVLDTRLSGHAKDRAQVKLKTSRLRLSLTLLGVAVILTLLASATQGVLRAVGHPIP